MAAFFRSVWGSIKVVAFFALYAAELLIKRPKTRPERADWLHRFCSTMLRGMHVTYSVEGKAPARGALISNHLSYIDIVLHAAVEPVVFCSKAEIEHWPVVGWMTSMAGTVYVQRGRGGSAVRASAGMQAAADAGLPVVFFPEGTTSNGRQILPFHSGLLAQALVSGEPLTAAYITYTLAPGNDPGTDVHDDVCYWGDINLLKHIFRFVSLRGAHALIRYAPAPIQFSSEPIHRKSAAVECRQAVLALARQMAAEGAPILLETEAVEEPAEAEAV